MDCFSGWCKSKRRLDGYTAIITGCNTGIGKVTATDFYLRGARVIMACRDTNKAETAMKDIIKENEEKDMKGTLVVEKLDLSNLRSVREFASRILDSEPKIQILVNNAGIMMCPEGKTVDGFETQMGTNHFSHALLTLLLLPRLIKSGPSRIVCVSSVLHDRHKLDVEDLNAEKSEYNALKSYSYSKAANVLFAKALAIKLKEHNINDVNTYSLHPGVIKTELSRHLSDSMWNGTTWVYDNIMGKFMKSPECGAQTSIYCAVDEQCADQSGLYYSDCAVKKPSKQCRDENVALQLYDQTIKALKLENYNPFGDSDPPKDFIN